MEEIFFSVIDSSQLIPKQLYENYPVVIDVGHRKNEGRLPVERLEDKHTIELIQAEARNLFSYESKEDYGVIFPDALSIGIRRYDWRRAEYSKNQSVERSNGIISSEDAFEELIRSSSANVKLKTDFSGGRIHHELSYCDIHTDATIAETIEIDAHNNEEEGCFHGENTVVYNHLLTESNYIGSGTCYDLGDHIQLRTIGDVGPRPRDHVDVLGRTHPRGEKHIIRRYGGDEVKTLTTSMSPDGFELKKKILNGDVAIEVEKRNLIKYSDEILQLDDIAASWIRSQNANDLEKIVALLERLGGKDQKVEPHNSNDIRERFRRKLLQNLQKTDGEIRNIRNYHQQDVTKRFAAVLIVTMCDTMNRAIWGDNRFKLVRGVYEYAKYRMGSIYYSMRTDVTWQLRTSYVDACPRICDRRRYIMQRYDYFSLNRETGDSIYKWDVGDIRGGKKTSRWEGWPYKSIEDEEEDEEVLIHDFDEDKYTQYMQRVIQGPWVEKDGIGVLMKEEAAIELFDFTRDAYVDEAGFLRLPAYYNKTIKSSLYESSFKIRRVEITHGKKADPWTKKTNDELKKENEMWLLPLPTVVDKTLCLTGNILSTVKQEQSVRFAAIIEALKKEKEIVKRKYTRDDTYTCPMLNVLNYTGYRQRRFIFSILKNHLPKDLLMEVYQDPDEEYDPHDYTDCMGKEEVLVGMRSIFEVILYLIHLGFENQITTYSEEEIRVIKHRMIKKEHRDGIVDILAPNFSRIIRENEKMIKIEKYEDLLPMYFYQALVLSNEMIYENMNKSHPMLMFCDNRVRIVPVQTNSWRKGVPLLSTLFILKYYAGWCKREETIEDDIRTVWPHLTRYWLDVEFQRREIADGTVIRMQPLKTHLSTYCSYMSEVYSFALPIVHPTKGIIAVGVIPDVISNAQGFSIIKQRFYSIERYVHARVILRIQKDGSVNVYGEGDIKCNVLDKFCCGKKTKIIRVRLNGKVYANPEIISKLMN
uniref:Outer capsid protein VP2 n=1 Tax=Epizootic hemorrhagic disease virus 2 TaxID=33721 RepID=A0A3G2KTU0_9REOV|nr:viral protein 2 [Epizootic hemorrhagic disease virus 2]